MTEEPQLLIKLRERSPAAFQQLFSAYSDKIYRLAVSILENEDDAEDIVQEVFTRFFENLDRFEGRSKIGTWLYRVAYNASIDRLRKYRSRPVAELDISFEDEIPLPDELSDWSESAETVFDQQEIRQKLEDAIQSLPETLRVVFLLRDVEELSTLDTANILEITPGAVKVRLHRARLLLRDTLSGIFEGAEQRNKFYGM
ncbi:MAG: sigma-70 family RNA polymerase sigma factor [Anaerolineales bacterium]|jgi:RNA polymerase sigma-70 factor (ECF subfamily)